MEGNVALVTGGASGVGLAVVQRLLGSGWTVFAAGRDRSKLHALEDDLAHPSGLLVVPADVTDRDSVRGLFAFVLERAKRLDLLFNNAGIFGPSSPLEDVAYEDWQAVVDVNLNGAFLCAQEAFRMMRSQVPQGGRIINNGSLSAHVPRPNAVAYTATKHAISGLTKALSLEGRRYSIACGQVDIGNAATDMTSMVSRGMLQADGKVAPEPTFPVDHVAQAVAYMASLPRDTNVQFMTVMATNMPFIGRG